MSKVIVDMSASLDGYISGPGAEPDVPLGVNGERLHEWLEGDRTAAEDKLLENSHRTLGAVICGRRTYDHACKWWGLGKGPAGDTPVFVVSHGVHEPGLVEGSPFTFVGDGIESALWQAREVAGEKDVCVMGGADVAQPFLRAGLVDDLSIHLVPIILGGGARLLDNLDSVRLRLVEVIESPAVTHLRYEIDR